jgi:hypothetical protein
VGAQTITFVEPVIARYVELELLRNFGDSRFIGLSEVRGIAGAAPTAIPASVPVTLAETDGSLALSFPTESGLLYRVYRSFTLETGSWAPVGRPLIGDGAVQELTFGAAAERAFYQILVSTP